MVGCRGVLVREELRAPRFAPIFFRHPIQEVHYGHS
ncbi:hypothetical protein MICABA_00063 [Microbacterium sp. T2.11-28]|nr:hypothetical protein MICABA_00063 [Microbacterium sp. T2.11-28]